MKADVASNTSAHMSGNATRVKNDQQRGIKPSHSQTSMRIPALLLGDVFMTCNTLSGILSSEVRKLLSWSAAVSSI
jgi:hypothetical protein